MSLFALCCSLTGCKPYKVLAGELSLNSGGMDYTIDKAKVEITLKENKSVTIPLIIKNNENAELSFDITARTPDFTTSGFITLGVNNPISIVLSEQNVALLPYKSGKIDIEVMRSKGEAQATEIWISVKDKSTAMIHKELVMRILVNVKD
jgi:hypothetical protein